jgi:hypothetical protein
MTRTTVGKHFFVVSALAMFIAAFLGFAPTFYLRVLTPAEALARNPPMEASIFLHGVAMTAWYLLFIVQTWLVASGRPSLHKRIGWAGLAVAAAVVITGAYVSLDAPSRLGTFVTSQGGPAGVGMQIGMGITLGNLIVLAFFSTFMVAAVLLRRNRPWHGRLMYWSSLLIIGPAIFSGNPLRFWPSILGPLLEGWYPVWLPALHVSIAFIALLAYDLIRTRRVHPATMLGLGAFYLIGFIHRAISGTQVAQDFIRSLL